MLNSNMQQLTLFGIEQTKIMNVSKVNQLSPFRYPGGKTWLVPDFINWIRSVQFKPDNLIEPFAGGGIISLSVAYYKLAEKCIMIEKDEDVASVWKTILYGDYKWLINQIKCINLTTEKAREIMSTPSNNLHEQAFKTIIKNRGCHGGIMADGSGLVKHGENGKGVLSRWYPDTLVNRIKTIVSLKERLEFYEGDAFEYLSKYSKHEANIFFVDPPYTASRKKAGKRLYRYSEINHEKLAQMLEDIKGKFMLTYDFDENIISLANKYGFNYQKVPMKGTHNSLRYELLIFN